jgi:hypothetical protein
MSEFNSVAAPQEMTPTNVRSVSALCPQGGVKMTDPAHVVIGVHGESDHQSTRAQFVVTFGHQKQAELTLQVPVVPEGEHVDPKLILYELMDALNAWREKHGPIQS